MSVELDYMEYASDKDAQVAYGSYMPDLTGGQTYAASTYHHLHPASHAFNNIVTGVDGWVNHEETDPANQWVRCQWSSGHVITKVRIQPCYNSAVSTRNVRYCLLEGSNNGSNWYKIPAISWNEHCQAHNTDEIEIDQIANYTDWAEIEFSNSTSYTYYRIYCRENWGDADYVSIKEIEMMEPRDLQCYSESTIKQQGSYSLKAIAKQTDSLDDTLIRALFTESGDLTGGQTYLASSQHASHPVSHAFDDNSSSEGNGWVSSTGNVTNQWVRCKWSSGKIITKVRIQPAYTAGISFNRNIRHCKLEGSNNGSSWTKIPAISWNEYCQAYNTDEIEIDKITNFMDWAEIDFTNSTDYTYYRIFVYDNWGDANYVGIKEIEMMESAGEVVDLSDQVSIKFDARASRTGSQFKISIHDLGGTTTEHTVNIAEVDTWQVEDWDISEVDNVDKDAIDEIKITILNADAENIFYLDNIYGEGAPGFVYSQVIIIA